MRNFSPFQVVDLRFQVDQINPKKKQRFQEDRGSSNNDHRNARKVAIMIKHKEVKMI